MRQDLARDEGLQAVSQYGREWAGSVPEFPQSVGRDLTHSYGMDDFRLKRLVFGRFDRPGDVHVYSANCHAGSRLRSQSLIPVLDMGGGLAPAFAVAAQSLPYSADVHELPLKLPGGFSAVVAQPPGQLGSPVEDRLTGARYYPGPVIDTRTLVSGRCYIVVWSPQNKMGKYALQIGHQWPLHWTYWMRTPVFWWRIRGWYGLSRGKAYAGGAVILASLAAAGVWSKRRSAPR
jgi:hypothetical protein